MKKILHLTLFLAIVSVLAGGALAFFNEITEPVIAKNNERQEQESLLEMYPDADTSSFEAVDISDLESTTINKINMSVPGYKDGTTFLVSINSIDLTIDKFVAISNGDTSGLGTQVLEDPFKESLEGNLADGELDTISGATVSSQPVVDGIHEAAETISQLK